MKYLYITSVWIRYGRDKTRRWVPPLNAKLGEKRGTECLTRFPLPSLLCAEYRVKLVYLFTYSALFRIVQKYTTVQPNRLREVEWNWQIYLRSDKPGLQLADFLQRLAQRPDCAGFRIISFKLWQLLTRIFKNMVIRDWTRNACRNRWKMGEGLMPSWRTGCGICSRSGKLIIIYSYFYYFALLIKQSAALSSASHHETHFKYGGKWRKECLNTRFLLPAWYSTKAKKVLCHKPIYFRISLFS